jgi:hypothetical protein
MAKKSCMAADSTGKMEEYGGIAETQRLFDRLMHVHFN